RRRSRRPGAPAGTAGAGRRPPACSRRPQHGALLDRAFHSRTAEEEGRVLAPEPDIELVVEMRAPRMAGLPWRQDEEGAVPFAHVEELAVGGQSEAGLVPAPDVDAGLVGGVLVTAHGIGSATQVQEPVEERYGGADRVPPGHLVEPAP